MIGVIMLMGLVSKNAILLVDFTNTLRERGYRREDALTEAGPTRLRPILMTTLAQILRRAADRAGAGARLGVPAAAGNRRDRRLDALQPADAARDSLHLHGLRRYQPRAGPTESPDFSPGRQRLTPRSEILHRRTRVMEPTGVAVPFRWWLATFLRLPPRPERSGRARYLEVAPFYFPVPWVSVTYPSIFGAGKLSALPSGHATFSESIMSRLPSPKWRRFSEAER